MTNWRLDEFSGGSYSVMGMQSRPEHFDILAEPVDGRLLFAGEATSSAFSGYVHGAMATGIREAGRILGAAADLDLESNSRFEISPHPRTLVV